MKPKSVMDWNKKDDTFIVIALGLILAALLIFVLAYFEIGVDLTNGDGMATIALMVYYLGGHLLIAIAVWIAAAIQYYQDYKLKRAKCWWVLGTIFLAAIFPFALYFVF
ncbi:hypothetical protein [Croceiramulus getboli]|nr:hypothetical protein P8624_02340 [Flavobacteriaceae bacterium YJPT1-3]